MAVIRPPPTTIATSSTACGLSGMSAPSQSFIPSSTTPPITADSVRDAWLAAVPYQGTSRTSRRSIVHSIATTAPAVGPPNAIAAMMNGKWNVRTPWPCMRSTRVPPRSPIAIQKIRPRRIPSRPPVAVSEMVSSIGNAIADHTRAASPAAMVTAVYAASAGWSRIRRGRSVRRRFTRGRSTVARSRPPSAGQGGPGAGPRARHRSRRVPRSP